MSVTINKEALEKSIKDYWTKEEELIHYSFENGSYGVLGSGTQETLLKQFLEDYLERASGLDKPLYQWKRTSSRGMYFCDRCGAQSSMPLNGHRC